jgi:hypothetical protein
MTQAQLTPEQRNTLASATRSFVGTLQTGDVESLRARTLPAVAADFGGIAASVHSTAALIQRAVVSVEALYWLEASADPANPGRTQFFCGSPTVVLSFEGLPRGTYALAITHATGVAQPQQISLILAKAPDNSWQLAGLYIKPMIAAGHDGLWYWKAARQFAAAQKSWNAWLYYHLADSLLEPLDALSSPNLEALRHEEDNVHPTDIPGSIPVNLVADGGKTFTLSAIDATTAFGNLDLDLRYAPTPSQAAELRTPSVARTQVTTLMATLLTRHPELREAFHGIWVHADQDNSSLFALDLPMSAIGPAIPQR